MGKTVLIADSACDLELKHYTENNIRFIPLNVHIENAQYKDILQIESDELFRLMKKEGKMPSTSQVTPNDFVDFFTKVFLEGAESIIYIAFSSNLSGTYQSAVIATKEFEGKDITVIDSKCASLGYGLVVLKAAELLKAGASKDEIITGAKKRSEGMEHIFTVEDLKYLQKGGRISFTKAMLGTMLNLKPVMHVEDGRLFPFSKAKGRKKSLHEMVKVMKERITNTDEVVGICNASDMEAALLLEKMIREELPIKKVIHTKMGATVGSHVGPGCLALFFEGKHDYISL